VNAFAQVWHPDSDSAMSRSGMSDKRAAGGAAHPYRGKTRGIFGEPAFPRRGRKVHFTVF